MRAPLPLARFLASLIQGAGSEFLRGDLLEEYQTGITRGKSRARAEAAYIVNVLASVARWWSPSNLRQKNKNERDGSYDPQRTWRGQGGGQMGDLMTEVRQGMRGLARRPSFTLLTVLTLGLGIGATTTIVSVVDSVVLRPLPYEDPATLMSLGATVPGQEWRPDVPGLQSLTGVSYLNFLELQERTRSFQQVAGLQGLSALLPEEGRGPEILTMAAVTENFLPMLGARLEMGRAFSPEEYQGSAGVVLLSYNTWVTRFGSDPAILGTPVAGKFAGSDIVVGVLAQDFTPPAALQGVAHADGPVEFWVPLDIDHRRYESRGARSLALVGRLASGATVESARSELGAIAAEVAREFPEGSAFPNGTHIGYGTNTLLDETVGSSGRTLIIFLGAAALLLAISALNAANLLLVRGLDRTTEMGVRRALGAGRISLVRQVLTESVLLSGLGGLLGVGLAYVGVELFLRMGPEIPRMAEVGVDSRILVITAAVSVGAGILTGLAPVWGVGRSDLASGLRKDSGRAAPVGNRLRSTLVTFQLGLALMLAVGATLLLHSFIRLTQVDPGFEPEGLTAFTMPVKRPQAPPEVWQSWDELLAATRTAPGLSSVGATSNLPFEQVNWAPAVLLPEDSEEARRTGIAGYIITPNYLETAGITVLEGRDFNTTDGPTAQPVALVNRAFVRMHAPQGNPIGLEIRLPIEDGAETRRVVGVVEDVVQIRPEDGWEPAVYVPYTQLDWAMVKVVVRSETDPETLSGQLREAAARFTPFIPVLELGPLTSRIRYVQTAPRFQAILLSTFAVVALLLAAIGLYGSLAHSVGRRTRELGVRVALGAAPRTIYGLVLGHGLRIAVVGLGIGLAGSVGLSRLLERYLFEVAPLDPTAFLLAALGLVAAALLAVLRPASRAARVDVVGCLKAD